MRHLPSCLSYECYSDYLTMYITIDHISVEVTSGMTVMQAALSAGIRIPALCYREGFSNHPSCMVCMVKDVDRNTLIPSCATPVIPGTTYSTCDEEVIHARKEALELLLSDHVGDCEAPCRLSCPAFVNIPLMNRYIAAKQVQKALDLVREEIALPLVLGYICPAPCENACRRKKVDEPVSICLLKRFTAQDETIRRNRLTISGNPNRKRIAVIGTGPAGLSAAFFSLRLGYCCVIYDQQPLPGGALRSSIPDDLLPKDMLDADIDVIRQMGAEFILNYRVTAEVWEKEILPGFDAVILATGFRGDYPVESFGLTPVENGSLVNKKTGKTSLPGIFGCGSIIAEQLLSVRSVAQGKQAAMQADAYLKGNSGFIRKQFFNSTIGPLTDRENQEYMKEAIPDKRVDPEKGYIAGFTTKEAITEARRCMHCDCRKPEICKLRSYADTYHVMRKRFVTGERKQLTRNLQHDLIVYEPEKCIRCGLCIEITKKHREDLGLSYVGRGFHVRISVPFHKSLEEGLKKTARECVEACPTGALAYKHNESLDS